MNIANDPYANQMIAAHRAGLSVYAIAKAVGMGWRTVKRIVNLNVARRGKRTRAEWHQACRPIAGNGFLSGFDSRQMDATDKSRSSDLPPHSSSYEVANG